MNKISLFALVLLSSNLIAMEQGTAEKKSEETKILKPEILITKIQNNTDHSYILYVDNTIAAKIKANGLNKETIIVSLKPSETKEFWSGSKEIHLFDVMTKDTYKVRIMVTFKKTKRHADKMGPEGREYETFPALFGWIIVSVENENKNINFKKYGEFTLIGEDMIGSPTYQLQFILDGENLENTEIDILGSVG